MIIEQAFMALPEFLVGAPYLKYDDEGTLVMAYSMAILQELNGRNVQNPVAWIRGEVHYPCAPSRAADLHCNLASVGLATPALGAYGYREEAWLEAKFFRRNSAGDQKISGTTATHALLADLIRLASLPPEAPGPVAKCGRYLLHAYQGEVTDFLKKDKNASEERAATDQRPAIPARPAFERLWTTKIIEPGPRTLEGFRTADEGLEFDKEVGEALRGLELVLGVTNFVHRPFPLDNSTYLLVLTRLDSVRVTMTLGAAAASFDVDRKGVRETAGGDLKKIQEAVIARLA